MMIVAEIESDRRRKRECGGEVWVLYTLMCLALFYMYYVIRVYIISIITKIPLLTQTT